MKGDLTVRPDSGAQRGAATDCAIARPLTEKYGGRWSVDAFGVAHHSNEYNHPLGTYKVNGFSQFLPWAFDHHLPITGREIKLRKVTMLRTIAKILAVIGIAVAAFVIPAWVFLLIAFCALGLLTMVIRWRIVEEQQYRLKHAPLSAEQLPAQERQRSVQ